jgi:hypothetical protein
LNSGLRRKGKKTKTAFKQKKKGPSATPSLTLLIAVRRPSAALPRR